MKKIYLVFVCIIAHLNSISAQINDSIIIYAKLDSITDELIVKQEFKIYNHSQKTLKETRLHSWANAYSGRITTLNKTKLEDRKGNLHFSEKHQRGGINDLKFYDEHSNLIAYETSEREFIKMNLKNPWKNGQKIKFTAEYKVKIPFDAVTQYGKSNEGDYLLKYFFLQPATIDENGNWMMQHYKDFEEVSAYPTTYVLNIDLSENYHLLTDLEENENYWSSSNIDHFRIFITPNEEKSHTYIDEKTSLKINFGFPIDAEDKPIIDSLLSHQLNFLREHLGELPSSNLFISSKTAKEEKFFGVDDIDAWIMQIQIFPKKERNALQLIQVLTYEYVDRMFSVNKTQDHWIKNGLQFYLMMKYVDENFPDLKLSGQIADQVKILGLKPLNLFHAARLELNDRYKLLYLYLARQNYDQPINTPLDELSNMNQIAISGFKTGITFYYIDQYLGGNEFSDLIKDFSTKSRGKLVSQIDFNNHLIENANKDLSWFFEDYIDKKDKINFKLVHIKEGENDLQIKVKNQTEFSGPFQIVGIKNDEIQEMRWYVSDKKSTYVSFPKGDYDKIELNPNYLFPEFNDRDNLLRTKGLFKNSKKLQFKLYSDIENPEYSQIFMNPKVRWNNYDKFLLGIRFHNQSLLTRPYNWYIEPKYSTGTGKLTGAVGVQNTFTPRTSIFRSITIGGTSKYEHYDKDLSFVKWSIFSNTNFKKDPRTSLSHGILLSFDHLDKEVALDQPKTDENKYNLWNVTYYYSRPNYIHELHGSTTLQTTSNFQKIYGEIYYRWRFSPRKQLGVRLFAGVFISNTTDTEYFNFGLSKVSDYAFNLNMLGRSEQSGVLSQQYFLAEAGFKSIFEETVNQWIMTTNVEIPIWKMFDIYADAGVYKNSNEAAKFIYDSGIKVKFIPDFLELYFPIQSTLGFEPAEDKYLEKIRFTLSLDLNKIINHLRRGWY